MAEYLIFLVADGIGRVTTRERSRAKEHLQTPFDRFSVEMPSHRRGRDRLPRAARCRVWGALLGTARRPATTISGVAVSEQGGSTYWLVLNIGDSRTYRLAGDVFEQISVDHSTVQSRGSGPDLRGRGRRAPSTQFDHESGRAGSRAEPDYWLLPAAAGDRLLICSDGLSKELDAGTSRRRYERNWHPGTRPFAWSTRRSCTGGTTTSRSSSSTHTRSSIRTHQRSPWRANSAEPSNPTEVRSNTPRSSSSPLASMFLRCRLPRSARPRKSTWRDTPWRLACRRRWKRSRFAAWACSARDGRAGLAGPTRREGSSRRPRRSRRVIRDKLGQLARVRGRGPLR